MGMRNALANAALAFEKTLAVVCLKRFNESPQLGLHHAGKRAVDTRHPRKFTDACKVSRPTRRTCLINLIDYTCVRHVHHVACLSRPRPDGPDRPNGRQRSLSSYRLSCRLRSRSLILSRFSKAFLPLASQNSTLIWLPRVYMDTGMHVKPFSANLPAR